VIDNADGTVIADSDPGAVADPDALSVRVPVERAGRVVGFVRTSTRADIDQRLSDLERRAVWDAVAGMVGALLRGFVFTRRLDAAFQRWRAGARGFLRGRSRSRWPSSWRACGVCCAERTEFDSRR